MVTDPFNGDIAKILGIEKCPYCGYGISSQIPFCPRCKFDIRHGFVGKKRTGTCIYCPHKGKLSHEHVFGKWLNTKYPYNPTRHQQILRRPESIIHGVDTNFHEQSVSLDGRPYDLKTYNVCEKCNTGWMSTLHNEAKDFVSNFADGHWPELTENERKILTRWSIMVSINFQCFSRILYCPQNQRTELKEGKIPEGWKISIGLMESNDHAGAHYVRSRGMPVRSSPFDDPMPFTSSFICIERALIHAFNAPTREMINVALLFAGAGGRTPVEQIWPATTAPLQLARAGELQWRDVENFQNLFK